MKLKQLIVGVGMLALSVGVATASSHLLTPFTQAELDANWEADRYFPTDGVTSTSAFGRDDVARIGVDSTQTQPDTFRRTEGIKTLGANNFGKEVQVDLYIDPDWQDKAVRAGLWVVGDADGVENDGTTDRDNWFGIMEFVSLETATAGASATGDHVGWRIWDSATGWTNLDDDFSYGEWVTLGIELDTDNQQYLYTLNGTEVGTATGGEHFIREIFMNSYNYGLDAFPTFSNESYAAHWHVGEEALPTPTTKDDCKKGGWMNLVDADGNSFKNQGQCVSSVASQGAPGRNR